MKMHGSNLRDTLIGTASGDTIKALGGDDLIATAGGIDTILAGSGDDMITGFSFDLKASTSTDTDGGGGVVIIGGSPRATSSVSMRVDGGGGSHDIMLVELTAQKGVSEIDTFKDKVIVKNVEEFICNFASLTADQQILGSNSTKSLETIVVGSGTANIDSRSGDDFIYSSGGDDLIKAGNGSDFIHAGEGHNIVSGGAGADYFHFQVTANYQYTEITDFQAGMDKILISVSADQINLVFSSIDDTWEALESPLPVRGYGDGYLGVGPEFNDYVSYDYGREFDPADFTQDTVTLLPNLWAYYEQETGSVFARHYEDHPWGLELETILVAHVTPGTQVDVSDVLFRMI